MWVFNDGVPRSGKSYDSVKNHILPAIKRGRHVWARVNGLDHAKIAEYLNLSLEHVREHLHLVPSPEVLTTFKCDRDEETGNWVLDPKLQNALVVIDEVHEFFVKSRKELEPQHEAFFALFGQNGGDGVIITQWIKRTHDAVVARIEKKNTFQKLSAVGMPSSYLVTYYATTSPGKFQKVGSKKLKYDPAIFPLYDGYAPGADNTEVYTEGTTTVFGAMKWKIAIAVVVLAFGVWGLARFFFGSSLVEEPPQVVQDQGEKTFDLDGKLISDTTKKVEEKISDQPPPPVDPLKDLSDEQRFVVTLKDKGRPWLAMLADVGDVQRASVEWVDGQGNTVERLDDSQLRELGVDVQFKAYGVRLVAGDQVVLVTPWPREMPRRQKDHELYNTAEGGRAFASAASERGPAEETGIGAVVEMGERGDVMPRNPAQTVGGYTPPTTTL